MAALVVGRGNTATWSVTFLDMNGNPVTPGSATLYIAYPGPAGQPVEISIAMTNVASLWTASWNTGGANIGTVFWSAWSQSPESSIDGQFALVGNIANLAA
jgi:hypothetical protein